MLVNKEKYKFKKYDPKYRELFNYEKKQLINILPKNTHIEHIGSTAIPGLGGKGIIDILIGTDKPLIKLKNKLIKNKYKFIPQKIKGHRLFFRKDYIKNGKTRRVHIHLVIYDTLAWHTPINFKNKLLHSNKLVNEYNKIKKMLQLMLMVM